MRGVASLGLTLALAGCGDTTANLVTAPGAENQPSCGEQGCPAARPICEGASGACVECLSRTDCTHDDALICDATRGECVGCLTNLHCEEGEVCNAGLARCAEPCSASTPCREIDEPICNETLGVCVECMASIGCADGSPCIRGSCQPAGAERQEDRE